MSAIALLWMSGLILLRLVHDRQDRRRDREREAAARAEDPGASSPRAARRAPSGSQNDQKQRGAGSGPVSLQIGKSSERQRSEACGVWLPWLPIVQSALHASYAA